MKPFVKWAGGKRQIIGNIYEYLNGVIKDKEGAPYTYIEPFLGGGAVLFDLAPQKAIINDLNSDLINAYRVIASDKYEKLIEQLDIFKERYFEDKDGFYYELRAQDRDDGWPSNKTDIERAARMIFINKTCYNGLYRVNSNGQFNTPIGRYNNPLIYDRDNFDSIHVYLKSKNIQIYNDSYEVVMKKSKDGDIIYIDPPYDYEDNDGFTKYQMNGFTFEDFKKLKKECDKALDRGSYIILSNNATEKVFDLFKEDKKYKIGYYDTKFKTLRSINSKGENRRSGMEVIFFGMPSEIPFPQANDMKKILLLATTPQDILNSNDLIRYRLSDNIKTFDDRQMAYYFSALRYFGLISQHKEYTDKGLELSKSEQNLIEYIKDRLLNTRAFKECYDDLSNGQSYNKDKIVSILEQTGNNLSRSTLERRSSTVKSWVEWIITLKK